MFYRVIVDIQAKDVDRIFDYRSAEEIPVGSRVTVPFGKKKIEGYVVGVSETTQVPLEKMKDVIRVVDSIPAITPEMLEVMRFMCARYHVTSATALRQFLPTEMRRGVVKESVLYTVTVNPDFDAQSFIATEKRAKKQAELLSVLLRGETEFILSELRKNHGATVVNGLIDRGALVVSEKQKMRTPMKGLGAPTAPLTLKPMQETAIRKILTDERRTHLLFGVTGSGKTEVYLRLIEEAKSRGKTAIMLVPEISLTPQMLQRLRSRFGDSVAILHSGLSAGERFDEWWRLRRGEATIAVGARSAVFAPLENLGIIIVDEEHDGSYQSDSNPRYFTKEIAEMRAERNGCKLVLGSATPSVESYLLAKEGAYQMVTMPSRVNTRPLPEMIFADMRKEVKSGNHTLFSSVLKTEMENALSEGNQVILFLNRRGYSSFVQCRTCGYVATCEDCDVSLTYHAKSARLKCHYCGAQYRMPSACPSCGAKLEFGNVGTERVCMELNELFPNAKVIRMDNDTTQNKEGHYRILKAFSSREADILVGTQMIAKGHDFPMVTLVGVLDADMELHFSDYRSGERTFQLVTQVAGRSGRAERAGKVVLQTFTPENYVLDFARRYDYVGMCESELALRRETLFPPFCTILRILVSGEDERKTIEVIRKIYDGVAAVYDRNKEDFLFFHKSKSPLFRLQNKYRYQILMRVNPNNRALIDEIYQAALPAATATEQVIVEENPKNMN